MHQTLLLPLLLLLIGCSLSGQEDAVFQYRHELTLTVGLHQGVFRDRNFSPLNYRSSGPRFHLRYGRLTRGGNRYYVGLGATLATLNSDVSEFLRADRYLADVSFGWQKGIQTAREGHRVFVGANYRSSLDITLFDGSEAVTFYALHGFEAAAESVWRAGDRQQFRVAAALPVFGLLSRPPYTGWDKFIVDNADNIPKVITRGRWTSLNDFFGLRADFGYAYSLSDRWWMEARYGLRYYATRRLDPVRSLNNSFSLSTTHQF